MKSIKTKTRGRRGVGRVAFKDAVVALSQAVKRGDVTRAEATEALENPESVQFELTVTPRGPLNRKATGKGIITKVDGKAKPKPAPKGRIVGDTWDAGL
jgi:hypothetical protein